MSIELLAMFVPVAIVVIVMKYFLNATISWGEFAVQMVAALLIVAGTYQAGLKSKMRDQQFLNGVVTDKQKETVSCEHSYQCRCRKSSDGTETCDTCYEHFNDYDWRVFTNAGKGPESEFLIDRIDRQGSYTPPRWTAVKIGEPVALERNFDNYILGAPDSIFHKLAPQTKVPAYPKGYDYMRADRIVLDGVKLPDEPIWNNDLNLLLSVLGPQKQANVIIVFTKNPSPQFADDLRNKWLGGKKNDVVVVMGTPNYPEIAWVNVFSWSKNDILNVALRNDLTEMKTVNRTLVISKVQSNIGQYFVRRPMAEYEYLKAEITPTPAFRIFGWIMAILAPLLIGFYFHVREDGGVGIGRSSGLRSFNNRSFGTRRFR